ncbi:transcription-repair coupling factor [Candidatus Zixiibacteriota bacterium]
MPLKEIQQIADRAPSFERILQAYRQGQRRLEVTGLGGSSKALLVSFLHRQLQVPVLTVTARPNEAEELLDDLTAVLGEAYFFQAWDALPYEPSPPSTEVLASRIETVAALSQGNKPALVTTIRALMQPTIAPNLLRESTILLKTGSAELRETLLGRLVALGFERLPLVEDVGQFSVRGGIMDIFPHGCENPYRVEFFGDEIESIRQFDVFSQRSIGQRDQARILPRSELLVSAEDLERISKTAPGRESLALMGEDPSFHGLQWVSSLFPELTANLLKHLPPETLVVLDSPDEIWGEAEKLVEEAEREFDRQEADEKIVPPGELYETANDIEDQLERFQLIVHRPLGGAEIDAGILEQEPLGGELKRLREKLAEFARDGYKSFILCDNTGQAQRLEELLEEPPPGLQIKVGALHGGFVFPEARLAVFTDHQIFNRYRRRHRFSKFRGGATISSYSALSPGDFVVHIDYGIGKYHGLEKVTVDQRHIDCLVVLYRDDDRLYVPIDQLKRVQKYIGGDHGPPALSRLGGTAWEKVKSRTKKAIRDMTRELIQLYAEREAKQGYTFAEDTVWQKELEASFIYEETPDQITAIDAIKKDMESASPMDRLVCGDVGYGKTEVAIRAAFKAVTGGKQVAVLTPTTILAQQHLTTFADRLADYPVNVAMLSRFKTRKEQAKILEKLKAGSIDIVVGTHRLVQKDVVFKDLGLVIVDEEQRFGVAHKERLKQLRRLVDVLTLTATPIPRTLYMSLMGARDLSVINTPPKARHPIRTEFLEFNETAIGEAILREVDRGGQIYFVHNRVQSIEAMAHMVSRAAPQIRIGIAHGQMPERTLESTMLKFLHGEYDCLVATTIIENGLDIPNVNTIIINRADALGLAQLYQLRGRVGRSHHLAYAYLLTPPFKTLSAIARKRLSALREFTALGSGFQLAMRDLEIRGAGNILGSQQHGFIAAVGFDLYCQLLDEAVRELKGEKIAAAPEPRLYLKVDAFIPDAYIPDEGQKVALCQRLSRAASLRAIDEIRQEMIDRYGQVPDSAQALLDVVAVSLLAREKGIDLVAMQDEGLLLEYRSECVPTAKEITGILDRAEGDLQFLSGDSFAIRMPMPSGSQVDRLTFIKKTLQNL